MKMNNASELRGTEVMYENTAQFGKTKVASF